MDQRILIIGAGFAGASTAYFLAQKKGIHVTLLEADEIPGAHASGRNAGMLFALTGDREQTALMVESRLLMADFEKRTRAPICAHRSGSLHLVDERLAQKLLVSAKGQVRLEELSKKEVSRRVPVLKDLDADHIFYCPDDFLIDIHALLQFYLEGARRFGGKVITGCRVQSFEKANGRVTGLKTSKGTMQGDTVINAAGAWSTETDFGLEGHRFSLTPYRRHLFVTKEERWINPSWPMVWDFVNDFYFRPELDGLLMSPCDEDAHPAIEPAPRSSMEAVLAEKVSSIAPALMDTRITYRWAGLRTFSPDRNFVIGWDPNWKGLFWVGGLGGKGVGGSAAIGSRAAEMVLQKTSHGSFDPSRF